MTEIFSLFYWQGEYFISKSPVMEQAFLEHLDRLYWDGYAEIFRADNPEAFQQQLTAFVCEHAKPISNKQIGLFKSQEND